MKYRATECGCGCTKWRVSSIPIGYCFTKAEAIVVAAAIDGLHLSSSQVVDALTNNREVWAVYIGFLRTLENIGNDPVVSLSYPTR
jgi:hypothetical protein